MAYFSAKLAKGGAIMAYCKNCKTELAGGEGYCYGLV